MFLSQVKANGNRYLYICSYHTQEYSARKQKRLYSLGKSKKAIMTLRMWKENLQDIPSELIELGCTKEDITDWIRTIETGITKTGKQFKATI